MSRDVSIRLSPNLNPSLLNDAFIYIQKQFGYPVESIQRPVHSEPLIHLGTYPDTFPNTIKEYYWINATSTPSNSWSALGCLDSGHYFFYTAYCATTPRMFLDGGNMNLWVSTRFSSILNFVFSQSTYQQYINETVATVATESEDPIDATSQMSHQASAASELSADAVPPAPFEQFL